MKLKTQDFVDWLVAKDLKPDTVKNYLFYFKKFKWFEFNQRTVNSFCNNQYNNIISRAFMKNLRQFIIEHREELEISPEDLANIKGIEMPKLTGRKKIRLIKFMSIDEVHSIERVMTSEKKKIMVLLIFFGGLRLGEFLKLRPMDFNWKKFDGEQQLRPCEIKVFGKGDKEGIAMIDPGLALRIRRWINTDMWKKIENNDPLFCPPQKRSWQYFFERASRKALGEKRNVHALRHSFATHLLSKGVDIKYIQQLLRHSSIMSTEIYLHVNKSELADKYQEVFRA